VLSASVPRSKSRGTPGGPDRAILPVLRSVRAEDVSRRSARKPKEIASKTATNPEDFGEDEAFAGGRVGGVEEQIFFAYGALLVGLF
jgi:hypothetical protein